MESTLICVLLLLNTHINSGHCEDDDGVAKAVLTIHPNSSQIFSGESVTLRCVIQGGGVTDWKYTWRKIGHSDSSSKRNEHEVSAAKISDSGDYRCLGSHQQQDSKWSDAVRLTVTPLPKATLTVEPNPVFPGETVTLTCSVESDSIWNYQWYKDRNDNVVSQSGRHTITGDTLTINGSTVNEGPYWCQGERESRPTSSSISDPVTITVNALPVASVSVSSQGLLYSGETVSLQCVIPGYTDWRYYWYKNNQHLPDETSKVIDITVPITQTGQAGQYRCEGNRVSRPTSSLPSDPVTLTVKALPVASVSVSSQGLLYSGETVSLQCVIPGYTDWRYYWYKNNQHLPDETSKVIDITVPITQTGQAGQYRCEGNRVSRPTSSLPSDPVTLTVKALPVASVSVSSQGLLYSGETVSLQCVIPGYTDWRYYWYKNNQHLPDETSKVIDITVPITQTGQAGQYRCEGNRVSRPTSSLPSDPVTLTVKALPVASVSVSPQGLLYSGETVSLQCVIPGYTDWMYLWFRDNQQLPSQTSKSITFPITQTGQYRCEGKRRDHPQRSQPSDYVTLSVTAFPKATLTVKPNPVFPGETVTLTCSVESDSIWSYQWYKDWNYNVVSQSVRHTRTGDTLTISSVAESDQGLYWCQGEIQSRSISSIISNPVTITLNALPRASVSISPQFVLYPGDTVTLQCDISDYTDWTYYWFIDNQQLPSLTRKTITISLPDKAGQYRCVGMRRSRPQMSYYSSALPIIITALPKATLTVKPNPVFPGETVTLTCSVGSDSSWSYKWYKDRNYYVLPQSVSHTITGDNLTISSVAESDHGLYWCQGEIQYRSISSINSDPVTITLNALPMASVKIVTPQGLLYPGETVTLQCDISEYTDWTYRWFRNNEELLIKTRKTIAISLPDQAGQYQCVGMRRGRPQMSYYSSALPIIITALPKATLTVKPNPVFPGETVTLTCSVGSDSIWSYKWYKDRNDNVVSQSGYSNIGVSHISRAAESDQGQYWCEGNRVSRPTYSQPSNAITLTVKDSRPTATLSSDNQGIFTGDRVTLSCTVESPGWKFYWYRHRPDSTPVTTTSGYSYTLSRVSVSDGGQYWCRAGRGDPVYYTLYSDPVQINITERPVAVLTLQPNWTQIFIRETVTMRCDIQGGGDSDWNYRWYKNSQLFIPFNTKPEYRISPVYWSNSGSYTCEGVKGNKFSKTSDAVQLTVSDQPKAVLSIFPQWMNPGDSVMLSCEVDKTSTGWRFSWYRTVPYRAGLPSLSDKSYSLQPLSDNVTSEDSYTLIPAGPTPTGGYVCRAGRGDPVYDTLYSEPQILWSGDLQPSVSLTVNPNTTQHFTSTSLSLSCEEKGNSTGWTLMRYTERRVKSGCFSNWGSITGSTCTISYTYTGYSGVFWCESGSGEYSNAVNITVNDGDVILESPVHPVTEGDSVNLTCTFRHQGKNPNPKTDFYKDGTLIKNETTGEMTIPAVSKSDEGFYKCKSGEGESPESWVTVRVFPVVSPGSSTSVLVGVVVGLLVAGVLLVILLVLLVRYQNSKGSCFNRIFWPPQPQSTNQDPQQDQGSGYTHQQHGDANIYDTINSSDNNDNVEVFVYYVSDVTGASAAGPSHVTYVQIQLKKLDNKKKEKLADPAKDPVYSVVKTGKATAAAGPDVTYAEVDLKNKVKAKKKRGAGSVDVTYAEVDLQRKAKAKKKRETPTPPETDSIYSLVKPYTVPGAAGPVDVTYVEVDLQKKVKTKKKRATPPEADSVYSQLKPRSCPGP
ncbi:basement membrane-specific heparan sulfate proteoglycan core protein-like isoform X3 [Oncorhynchus nerka]|uniref:basement membrane-specific heparan sulfate proteoglycan core protein-like isoform X3 n=1 Tax=Oncorhynchus nerka TaxID=8023 RepID=UPI0031B822AA